MTDIFSEFLDKMRTHGFEPRGGAIIADDKWHQAAGPGDTGRHYAGAYTAKLVSPEFAIGTFFSRKDPDVKYNWHSSSNEKLSPEEKKRITNEYKKKKKEKEAADEKKYTRCAERLTRAYNNLPILIDHPYLEKKGVKAYGLRHRRKGDELVLPLRSIRGEITSIQRITAGGGKYLFSGGKKSGSFASLQDNHSDQGSDGAQVGSEDDFSIICLAEGYATAATIREATGLPCFAAIDSGNLPMAALALRAKYVHAKFIICGDNDEFTRNAKGDFWNVGLKKAHETAGKIKGAFVVVPPIVNGKNTDFNDLAAERGLDEVRKIIFDVVNKVSVATPEAGDGGGSNESSPYQPPVASPEKGDLGLNFKVLGYNEGTFYYFPSGEKQIVSLTASAHTMPSLLRLDNLYNWRKRFGLDDKTPEKQIVLYAMNSMFELARKRGVFEIKDQVRASGAFVDEGRKILNCGDALYVDGELKEFDDIKSHFTYIASSRVTKPSNDPLTNAEAHALRQICEAVTWENKLSGSLLAGFLVIAPICGALSFRPHVWITGEAESGKSTVMDKIIKPAIGNISVNLDGRSTEPKIRELIGYGARPVIFDEAEKSPNIEAVIELARASTDGKHVGKFGQKVFKALSCFCFSAINPPVNKVSDESRIVFMTIKKNTRPTADEEYGCLLEMIDETITSDYAARMLARTLNNMDTLFENIKTFEKAARRVVKSARAAQMIGSMLGGLYLLSKTDLISLEDAQAWITKYDWTNHTIVSEDTDPVRLLQYLSSSLLSYEGIGISSRKMTIGDLILMASETDTNADRVLRNNGIAVKDNRVYIAARSHNLARILRETDWSNKWTAMLSNLPGAEKLKSFYFGVGNVTSCVSIPLPIFTSREPKEEKAEEFPF